MELRQFLRSEHEKVDHSGDKQLQCSPDEFNVVYLESSMLRESITHDDSENRFIFGYYLWAD